MRTWDAEAGGWRIQIPGTDRTYLSNSDEGRAMESAWEQQAQEKRDAHFANVGNWQQYEGGTLEDFTSALNQDPFFAARLPHYAHDVMNGDTLQYNQEFTASSGATARGHELTNRYIALLNQGYTDQEIMGAGYGNDGSSWANVDPQSESSTTTPTVDLSNYTPMDVGTGFLGGYNAARFGADPSKPYIPDRDKSNRMASVSSTSGGFLGDYQAKREAMANKPSVMSLFKEMENYEQSPQ